MQHTRVQSQFKNENALNFSAQTMELQKKKNVY